MHSEGILSGELKHGPLAMIDKDMLCIMVITKDNTYKVIIDRCDCVGVYVPYSGLFSWGANFRYFRDSSTSHEIFHPRNFQPIIALCNTS